MGKGSTKYQLIKQDLDSAKHDIRVRTDMIMTQRQEIQRLKTELENERKLRILFEDSARRYKSLANEFALEITK